MFVVVVVEDVAMKANATTKKKHPCFVVMSVI